MVTYLTIVIQLILIISVVICIILAPIPTLDAFHTCIILKMPKAVPSTFSVVILVSFSEFEFYVFAAFFLIQQTSNVGLHKDFKNISIDIRFFSL